MTALRVRRLALLANAALAAVQLAGCTNGTVFESDVGDLNKSYIAKEYGPLDKPDAVVPIREDEREVDYRVWIGKTHQRVMIESTKEVAEAAAGYTGKLSMGVLKGRPAEDHYREAALHSLASTGKVGCSLERGSHITSTAYEWNYSNCSSDAGAGPKAKK